MTAGPFLLDASVLLALVRGKGLGCKIEAEFDLRAQPVRPRISIVTHGEIRVMAARGGWGAKKLDALTRALDERVTVGIDHPRVFDAYVELDLASGRHPRGARNRGKNDLGIAACARATESHWLTTDRDFDHLDQSGLRFTWIDPAST